MLCAQRAACRVEERTFVYDMRTGGILPPPRRSNAMLGEIRTFAQTLDTADFVPEKYNKKILAYIFKNMKRQFRRIDKADRQYQKGVAQKEKAKRQAESGQ